MTRRWTQVPDPNETAGRGFTFFNNGTNVKNKWLDYEGSNITCFKTPGIAAGECILRELTYSNERENTDIDIEIYVNGVGAAQKVFTWQVRNSRCGYKTDNLDSIGFSAGDKIRVFMRFASGTTPQKPVVKLEIINISGVLGEGFQ